MSKLKAETRIMGGGYNSWFDFLKGIAIVAVVMYHLGIMDNGYLGVDIFLVINGYLITQSLIRSYDSQRYSYIQFLKRRIQRLWPLILIAGVFCLTLGYFVMLPDDFENLAESVVASNLFANNILAAITDGNYWDVRQIYKPLMHTWYVGLVFQFYLIYPLIVKAVYAVSRKLKKKIDKVFMVVLIGISIVSFLLYVASGRTAYQFYYLPYRIYELTVGGLACLIVPYLSERKKGGKRDFAVLLAVFLVFLPIGDFVPDKLLRLVVVACSMAAVLFSAESKAYEESDIYNGVVLLGKMSYSIFIWHQIIFAFYRYVISSDMGAVGIVFCLIMTAIVSLASFKVFEERINKHMIKMNNFGVFIEGIICCLSTLIALIVYINAGVVRDVPELDIWKSNIHRGMHAEYNDKVYSLDQDFTDNDNIKVLSVGNSFARDWCNVLLESQIADQLEIRYIYSNNLSERYIDRIKQADFIFIVAEMKESPDIIMNNAKKSAQIWGIGTKRYGDTNGNIYANRNREGYFLQTASYDKVAEQYESEKMEWEDHYIDFIEPVLCQNGEVKVFTDDNMFISQDCRHLTRAGAKYYSRTFDLEKMFGIK